MRKLIIILICTFAGIAALAAQTPQRILYVYEEQNDSTVPWRTYFASESAAAGFTFEEIAVADIGTKNLSAYDIIILHGMVMAFTSHSPIRDWLKTSPVLSGKPIGLFITANRWFLEKYTRQINALLSENQIEPIDAVSAATKDLTEQQKRALVQAQLERVK